MWRDAASAMKGRGLRGEQLYACDSQGACADHAPGPARLALRATTGTPSRRDARWPHRYRNAREKQHHGLLGAVPHEKAGGRRWAVPGSNVRPPACKELRRVDRGARLALQRRCARFRQFLISGSAERLGTQWARPTSRQAGASPP
jgi:hypothetical protein